MGSGVTGIDVGKVLGEKEPFFLTLFADSSSRRIEATVSKESLLAYIGKDEGTVAPNEASLAKPNQGK